MNYAIIFSSLSFSPLSPYLCHTHLSLCLSHPPPHTHTHSEDKHSTSVYVSTEIDATVNSQDLRNHIPRI